MDGGAAAVLVLPCRSLGIGVCHRHRSSSGLSASSSYFTASIANKVSRFEFLDDMWVGRVGLGPVAMKPSWCREERFHRKRHAAFERGYSRANPIVKSTTQSRARALLIRAKVQDCENCCPEPEITASIIQTRSIWDQCIRVVQTEGSTEGEGDEASRVSTSAMFRRTRHAGFAAISARTHRPPLPPRAPPRSKLPQYISTGIVLSMAAFAIWQVNRSESYARDQLISRDPPSVTSPPQTRVDSAFERAKASVAQTACVNRAVAAVRMNNFMECTIEMELALEENRLARTSIESDFYEEEEIVQVYQGVIKMWTDGYPLDYGKVLQLRSLLDLPSPKAEALEDEVLQQSDAYVI